MRCRQAGVDNNKKDAARKKSLSAQSGKSPLTSPSADQRKYQEKIKEEQRIKAEREAAARAEEERRLAREQKLREREKLDKIQREMEAMEKSPQKLTLMVGFRK